MKALFFHQLGKVFFDNFPDPEIRHSQEVISRVTANAICGSDLHIYNGFIPQKDPMIMGHEFMGIVEEVGDGVTELEPGPCEHSNPENTD